MRRKKYLVVTAIPKGNGHWHEVGSTPELLPVEAAQWLRVGRLEEIPAGVVAVPAEQAAEQAAEPAAKPSTRKTASK